MAADLDQVAAALTRRGVVGVTVEYPGHLAIPDGKGGTFEVGTACECWAGDHYATLEDYEGGAPGEGFATEVQSGSDDVERIAAAIVRAIAEHGRQ